MRQRGSWGPARSPWVEKRSRRNLWNERNIEHVINIQGDELPDFVGPQVGESGVKMSNLTGLQDFVEWDVGTRPGRNPVASAHKCVPRPLPTLCPAFLGLLVDHHFLFDPSGSSSHFRVEAGFGM